MGQRAGSFVVDAVLEAVPYIGVLVSLGNWIAFRRGKTLGLRLAGARIMRGNGDVSGFFHTSVRTFAAVLSLIPLGLGFWWAFWDGRRQTWHDKIMNTYVAKDTPELALRHGTSARGAVVGFWLLIAAISVLGIVASLTAVAVTGTTSSSKGVTKAGDESTVTKAVSRYSAEHPGGRFPTLDGCLPGEGLNLLSLTCSRNAGTPKGEAEQEFTVDEISLRVDADLDGAAASTAVEVVPIVWKQHFTYRGETKTFEGDFLKAPRHAFEEQDGDSFLARSEARPEDDAPVKGVPDIASCHGFVGETAFTPDPADCPVWVLNEFGDAVALLPGTAY